MNKYFLTLIFLAVPRMVWSGDPGTSGADILKVPIGVRPAALGGTYSAFGDDVYVIGFNPAGLARVSKYSLGIDHVQGFADVQVEALSVAVPTQNYGNFGGQIIFRHLPNIQNVLAADPPIAANDLVITVADAQQFGKIAVGGSFKTIISNVGEKQAFTQAFDVGIKYQFLDTDISVVAQNIGPPVQFQPNSQGQDPLPLTFRLGIARPLIVSPSSTLLASVEGFNVRDEGPQASIGLEYWHRSLLAVRVGYRFSDPGNLEGGFSAGAALRYNLGKLEYEIGYAWRPAPVSSTFIGNSHILGLLFWY